MPDRLLSTYQVADLVGATPGAVVEWVQKGLLGVQSLPDGALRIPQEALVQFLKTRGQEAEPILARLWASQPVQSELQAADVDLPRLDLAEFVSSAARVGPVRPESIERLFPLDPVASERLARPARTVATTAGQDKPPDDQADYEPAPSEEEDLSEFPPAQGEPMASPEAEPIPATGAPFAAPLAGEGPPDLQQPLAPQEDEGAPVTPVAAEEEAAMTGEVPPPVQGPSPPAGPPQAAVTLIRDALARRASEIHLISTAEGLSVQLRIDGLLHEADRCGLAIPTGTAALTMQQLLDLAGTRHGDPRRPSAGQANLLVDGREVTVTATTCPTTLGQRMVVSLADPQAPPVSLSVLGLDQADERGLARALAGPSGLVLLVSCPGAQRTAALEAMVRASQAATRSVAVVTHRPAAPLPSVTAIVASASADFSVAQAVCAATEQDADVIITDDIRDAQTVPALMEAAEAGRLVLAATCAPSAASAVAMLLEAGLEPWVLASHLKAVVATTSVRRLCPHCRQEVPADDETLARLGLRRQEVGPAHAASGCDQCFGIGYLGVVGCSSAMLMDTELAAALRSGPGGAELTEAIEQAGARPLLQVGLDMVREGLTSLEELVRCLPF